jgi:phosphatidylserine/phosphatidylglycerophosphate/cardiolipin synthase-like enzyme
MRLRPIIVVSVFLLLAVYLVRAKRHHLAASSDSQPIARQDDSINVYFSPGGGCTQAIVHEIDAAQKSIDIQAYTFTSSPIADAVLAALNRGVAVRVILDKSQEREPYSSLNFLYAGGVPIWVDENYAIAHNKIILIDGTTILTGSFNFTREAETENAENLLVIQDHPSLYRAYANNFTYHLEHALKYGGASP